MKTHFYSITYVNASSVHGIPLFMNLLFCAPILDAVAVPNSNVFGRGTGPIYVDNAGCVGSEPRLLACNYDTHTADCFHSGDVGVRCNATCELKTYPLS